MNKRFFVVAMMAMAFPALALPALAWAAGAKQSGEIAKIDRIVAVVDQVVITENELADRIKIVTAQLEKQGTQLPPQNVLEKQILEKAATEGIEAAKAVTR